MAVDYRRLVELLEQGSFYLYTVLKGEDAGQAMAYRAGSFRRTDPDSLRAGMGEYDKKLEDYWVDVLQGQKPEEGFPRILETDRGPVYAELWADEPELVLCGGGHVSQELAKLADYMEYPYTVIDDREEFTSRERFPGARRRLCAPFSQVMKEEKFSSGACYIIVTRGHAHDLYCLEQALGREYGYVGMIGSRKKVDKAMEELRRKGWPQEKLGQVHAPIGLPLGGSSPKEVAVSILAQLIQIRNQGSSGSSIETDVKRALLDEETRPAVLARITGKRGSAPRGAGSRMVVGTEGLLAGTIGGGKIEAEAVERAKAMAGRGGCAFETYRLDTETAGSLGMWCGGEVDVFFEDIGPRP